jgi:hypothetical protein
MSMAKTSAIGVAAIFSVVAAVLWTFASYQKVSVSDNERDETGMRPFRLIRTDGADRTDILMKTSERQTFWNGWAALAAAIAALA